MDDSKMNFEEKQVHDDVSRELKNKLILQDQYDEEDDMFFNNFCLEKIEAAGYTLLIDDASKTETGLPPLPSWWLDIPENQQQKDNDDDDDFFDPAARLAKRFENVNKRRRGD